MGNIGNNIRAFREAAHLTQDELAERAGVNRVTIAKYESGRIEPSSATLPRLAAALHISADALLGEDRELLSDEDREIWEAREAARRDPERNLLFRLARNGSAKDVKQVVAIIDALRATNPDFYSGDDPS